MIFWGKEKGEGELEFRQAPRKKGSSTSEKGKAFRDQRIKRSHGKRGAGFLDLKKKTCAQKTEKNCSPFRKQAHEKGEREKGSSQGREKEKTSVSVNPQVTPSIGKKTSRSPMSEKRGGKSV